jgi:SNF2 family DNA or RNA helicase
VRIDPDHLRRARSAALRERERHTRVSALELLQLLQDQHLDLALASAAGTSTHLAAPTDPTTDDRSPTAVDSTLLAPDWIGTLFGGLDDEHLDEAHEPESFIGTLRPYQRRGLGWLQFLARVGLGGCLADDMGLGKTATTLAHLLTQPGPHLVICPLSVVHNWESEARRFTPSLAVHVHHGAGRELGTDPDADLVITTYGLAQRDTDLHRVAWGTVVLDEAQMVKNPNTKAARAVRRLVARQKVALTGTPVENRLVELWSILDAVVPGVLGSQQRFRERYAMPIERHGDAEVAERLRTVTAPFVLRRTKADRRLLPDLPDKIEQIAYAELTAEQAVLYQQVAQQLLHDAEELTGMQRRGRVLAALTRLKQICNHPAHALADDSRLSGRSGKLTRFDELLVDLLDVGERALVFTQFREMGTLLHRHLEQHHGIAADFLHGGVSRTRRQAMIDHFHADDGPPVLLVSLKAGGTGLNLIAASQVIHYDRWWNPAVEDQATDRAWRLGQRRTVNVHKLVSRGTIEERIGQVIDEKRQLAQTVVGTSENWLANLSADDLRQLVVLEHQRPGVADRHRPRAAGGDR